MKSLKDCRVLDLGIVTAGAAAAAILSDLGADVIKIESETYMDPFRTWGGEAPKDKGDLPPFFRMTNRGKSSLCLNLKSPDGVEVFLDLVRQSDVVVENFRRGVLQKLGLDYSVLKEANPNIILASISSQGESGPDAGYVSFGSTLEAMSGLAAITGYQDGPPVITGRDLNYPDQVVSIFAASMISTAWYAKECGQGGCHLDISQRELTSFLAGDAFYKNADRRGNQTEGCFVQECFLSKDAQWIALTLSPEQENRCVELTGGNSVEDIKKWVSLRTAEEVLDLLRKASISASRVLDGVGVVQNRGKSWKRALQEDAAGMVAKGVLFEVDGVAIPQHTPSAALGLNSSDVLKRVAGYSDDIIRGLIDAGVVSGIVSDSEDSVDHTDSSARL